MLMQSATYNMDSPENIELHPRGKTYGTTICNWLCKNPPCLRILHTSTKTAVKP